MSPRELASAALDGFADAGGMLLGSSLLLAVAGVCAAWDVAHRIAPRKFEARRPLITF